ncbi:hypothetical protein DNHGIG_20140 [Collibacillus ludicampi]|jgi:hypothetical protein|uniref:Uncharacterized protein n=1 Tax=Collibacillus ludicampi TaxID=2771369 RepID=A0AAV4LF79_9BACL|nr:hypothetical protein [Collibacillus ludicampi]GIM46465.1 hypothetical protein DNHGIG_20140 [Collibacillus ludicampi]
MDPTIFDNLKVVLEGSIYDIDRDGIIVVVDRADLVDLARMQRYFRMGYVLTEARDTITCEVEINSQVRDFAAELQAMRLVDEKPGVRVSLCFRVENWKHDDTKMDVIHEKMKQLWEDTIIDHSLEKSMDLESGTEENRYICTLMFRNKIDESNVEEIPRLLEHTVKTMEWLLTLLHT